MTYAEYVKAKAVLLNWNTIDNVTVAIVDELARLLGELRAENNYAVADRLRNSLVANGVAIGYEKDGTVKWHWAPKVDYSAKT